MSIIAEIQLSSSEFVLSETLEDVPDVVVDIVQIAGIDPQHPYLLFWVSGDDIEAFEEALQQDRTVDSIEQYSEHEDAVLYRARITDEVEAVIYPVWVEAGLELIAVEYDDGWWNCRLRVPGREALTAIETWCEENGVTFDLQSVYTNPGPSTETPQLTSEQREVLRVAMELGYFDIPRQATLSDVAGELDISTQAASERLRRGHKRLIKQKLGPSVSS